jgi:hypothetical protein
MTTPQEELSAFVAERIIESITKMIAGLPLEEKMLRVAKAYESISRGAIRCTENAGIDPDVIRGDAMAACMHALMRSLLADRQFAGTIGSA